jgi:hypothetical protein
MTQSNNAPAAWSEPENCIDDPYTAFCGLHRQEGDGQARPALDASGSVAQRPAEAAPARLVGKVAYEVACTASGLLVALMVGLLLWETQREPFVPLLALSGAIGAVAAVLLHRACDRRVCDRAIVIAGGLVATVLGSLMLLE